MNQLLIAFNPTPGLTDVPREVHRTIEEELGVSTWWHYLPYIYMVITESSSAELTRKISALHPQLQFLVVKVNLDDVNGVLSKSAFDWISEKTNKKINTSPAPLATDANKKANSFLEYLKNTSSTSSNSNKARNLDDLYNELFNTHANEVKKSQNHSFYDELIKSLKGDNS